MYKSNVNSKESNLDIPRRRINEHIRQLVAEILKNTLPKKDEKCNARSDIFLGQSGIAYMFWRLSKTLHLRRFISNPLNYAWEYMTYAMVHTSKGKKRHLPAFAFLRGDSGVYAIATVIANDLGLKMNCKDLLRKFRAGINCCMDFIGEGEVYDAFPAGRAGYLLASYWLNGVLQKKLVLSNYEIGSICQIITLSGYAYAGRKQCPVPLMFEYDHLQLLGAGTGISSILLALLGNPWYGMPNADFKTSDCRNIQATIDYLVSLQRPDGSFPAYLTLEASNKSSSDVNISLIDWCHGAAGISFVLAKAYRILKKDEYLESLRKASDYIWLNKNSACGNSICRGLAGIGYHFLLMYRLTQEHKYLNRAISIAETLMDESMTKEPQNQADENRMKRNMKISMRYPYSLFGGTAGVVCFLIDVLEPNKAEFPFMNVF